MARPTGKRVAAPPLGFQEKQDLARFIQHYERITRRMLRGGVRADVTAHLDEDRKVVRVSDA